MSGLEVATVVSSIIAAFGSGMDLFKKMRTKAKAKKQDKHGAKLTQDELRLRESLCRGPQQIQAEYDKNVARLGHRFKIGDPIAHSSLVHILIVLNTGLVNILDHALSEDSKAREMSKRSLLGLSELATADTMNALGQLNKRLTSVSSLVVQPQPFAKTAQRKKTKTAQQQDQASMPSRTSPPQTKEKKRPDPDPLARGGWIRSKSGTSVVSSGLSTPRPVKKKRSHSSPFPAKDSPLSQPEPKALDPHPAPGNSPCVCGAQLSSPRRDIENRRDDPQAYGQPRIQEPDLLLASPDVFSADLLPPRPPKIPLERPVPSRKPRPPSVATFLTASTKIGEIPEHRWLDRPASPWDDRPLPYVIPPPLEPEPVKRKTRGFKFWWKSGSRDERSTKSEVQV
jgi:hypothetical protein